MTDKPLNFAERLVRNRIEASTGVRYDRLVGSAFVEPTPPFTNHGISPRAAEVAKPDPIWRPMTDIGWIDGSDVVLLAHDMEVQARYSPGEWSEDTPVSPREYSGAVWVCFDDQFQFEIEEISHNPEEWLHGPVTHWRRLTPRP